LPGNIVSFSESGDLPRKFKITIVSEGDGRDLFLFAFSMTEKRIFNFKEIYL